MDIQHLITNMGPLIKRNSSTILTGLGVAGSVGSLILGIKASPGAQYKLDARYIELNEDRGDDELKRIPVLEVIQLVWLDYLPAVGLQIMSIACVVSAQSINLRKQAAVISAFSITEAAFREYQDRMTVEAPTQDRKVRDDIAAKVLKDNPVGGREVILLGSGDQLFFDSYSGRYFQATKQVVDKAVNDINFRILNQEYASVNEFYSSIGLAGTDSGEEFGWTADHPLELDFSTHITDDDRPAIVITFLRKPLANYWKGFQ